jgi:hypothetical protein
MTPEQEQSDEKLIDYIQERFAQVLNKHKEEFHAPAINANLTIACRLLTDVFIQIFQDNGTAECWGIAMSEVFKVIKEEVIQSLSEEQGETLH